MPGSAALSAGKERLFRNLHFQFLSKPPHQGEKSTRAPKDGEKEGSAGSSWQADDRGRAEREPQATQQCLRQQLFATDSVLRPLHAGAPGARFPPQSRDTRQFPKLCTGERFPTSSPRQPRPRHSPKRPGWAAQKVPRAPRPRPAGPHDRVRRNLQGAPRARSAGSGRPRGRHASPQRRPYLHRAAGGRGARYSARGGGAPGTIVRRRGRAGPSASGSAGLIAGQNQLEQPRTPSPLPAPRLRAGRGGTGGRQAPPLTPRSRASEPAHPRRPSPGPPLCRTKLPGAGVGGRYRGKVSARTRRGGLVVRGLPAPPRRRPLRPPPGSRGESPSAALRLRGRRRAAPLESRGGSLLALGRRIKPGVGRPRLGHRSGWRRPAGFLPELARVPGAPSHLHFARPERVCTSEGHLALGAGQPRTHCQEGQARGPRGLAPGAAPPAARS